MSRRRWPVLAQLLAVLCALLALHSGASARQQDTRSNAEPAAIASADLPPEARRTLASIRQGGPFAYERDGVVFGNFERLLPPRERGYYREYTVPTPGLTHRGARRIVAGRGGELYYSDDHYRTFKRIRQ